MMQQHDADFKNSLINVLTKRKNDLCSLIGHGSISRENRDEHIGKVKGIDESIKFIETHYKTLYEEPR